MSGTFGYAWEPEIEGTYTITASFMGDESYGSSWAQTYAIVEAAQEATEPTQPQLTMPPYEMYTVGSAIAVIVVVLIATVLLLKKRP